MFSLQSFWVEPRPLADLDRVTSNNQQSAVNSGSPTTGRRACMAPRNATRLCRRTSNKFAKTVHKGRPWACNQPLSFSFLLWNFSPSFRFADVQEDEKRETAHAPSHNRNLSPLDSEVFRFLKGFLLQSIQRMSAAINIENSWHFRLEIIFGTLLSADFAGGRSAFLFLPMAAALRNRPTAARLEFRMHRQAFKYGVGGNQHINIQIHYKTRTLIDD